MAIDMIERNDLSALANSRVGGLKQFVDDKNMNFVGHENYVSLFGSKKKKLSAARQQIQDKYKAYAIDCPEINSSVEAIESDLAILVGRSTTAKGSQKNIIREQMDETTKLLGEFKSRAIKLGCDKAILAAQEQQGKADLLSTLANYGAGAVDASKGDLAQGKSGGTNKLFLYGGIAVGVVLISVIIYKVTRK